jgi:fluoroquinolone resistance protein
MEPDFLNKSYDRIDFTEKPLTKGDYEDCRFISCDLSNADFSEMKFIDCKFVGCNLSLVKLSKTVFRDIQFVNCKMLGLAFYNCSEFGLSFHFDHCNLGHSSFYKTKTKKTVFRNSQLEEVDFTDCDLSNSSFENCNLAKARFENTVLEKVDFRTSYNYSIDPAINRIKKAKFSLSQVTGLLDKYDIEIDKAD